MWISGPDSQWIGQLLIDQNYIGLYVPQAQSPSLQAHCVICSLFKDTCVFIPHLESISF